MKELQVRELNEPQLLSFCSKTLADYDSREYRLNSIKEVGERLRYWIYENEENPEEAPLPTHGQIIEFLAKHYPKSVYFEGNEFIPCLLEHEEKKEQCIEMFLPILGDCKIYPLLKRIIYVDDCIYAEDYDVPATSHPETKRISLDEYNSLLMKEEEKIAKAKLFLSSL